MTTNPLSPDELVLKPCPFCASGDRELKPVLAPNDKHGPVVVCVACSALGPTRRTADQAIAAWNTRASIAAMPELTVQGWQAIESAPKDGTRILLWIEPTKIAMPFEWSENPVGHWAGDDFPLNMARPTHWMPLPEPPVESSNG